MSYILDALRKADAQRTREAPRGINAQPARGLAGDGAASRNRAWYWGAAVAGVGAVSWAGWAMVHDRAASKPVAPAPQEVVALSPAVRPAANDAAPVAPVAPMPSVGPLPAPVMGSAVQPPPVVVPPAVRIAQAPVTPPFPPASIDPRNSSRPMMRGRQGAPADGNAAAAQAPAAVPMPVQPQQAPGMQPPPGMQPQDVSPMPPVVRGGGPGMQPAPLAPPVAANAPPPPPVAGLPADAPKLSISGGVYSANRAQRMLIVNGQVFSEGSEITAGVVLEEVKPKIAVLRFRGARYTVSY